MKKLFYMSLVMILLLAAFPQASFASNIADFELGDGTSTYYGLKCRYNSKL